MGKVLRKLRQRLRRARFVLALFRNYGDTTACFCHSVYG